MKTKTQAEYAADLANDASTIITKLHELSLSIERHHPHSPWEGMEQAALSFQNAVLMGGADFGPDTLSPFLVWAIECFEGVNDAAVVNESTLRLYGHGAQPFKIDIPLMVMFDYAIYGVHVSWLTDSYPFPASFSSKLGGVVERHLEVVA